MGDYNFRVDVFDATSEGTYWKYALYYSWSCRVLFTDPIGGAAHLMYLANNETDPFKLEISDKARKELPYSAVELLEGIVELHNKYVGTIESALATAAK